MRFRLSLSVRGQAAPSPCSTDEGTEALTGTSRVSEGRIQTEVSAHLGAFQVSWLSSGVALDLGITDSPGFSSKTNQPHPIPTPTPKLCVHSRSQLRPPLRLGDNWTYSRFAGVRTVTESRRALRSSPAHRELELDARGLDLWVLGYRDPIPAPP